MIEIHSKLPKKKYSVDAFELDTGGKNHPSGHGSWKIRLESGKLTIHYANVREKRKFGPFILPEETNDELWKHVYSLGLGQEVPLRKGNPDEPLFLFHLWQDGELFAQSIWANDLHSFGADALVTKIKSLIEEYTQETPVF